MYDIIGNIAILKFHDKTSKKDKLLLARKILKSNKGITTVLEKTEKVSGRLRTIKTRYILGKKTKEALYKENGCIFRLNIDTCYFSPRLASERLEIAGKCKKNDNVLVLFSGVGPFSIVIAKLSKCKVTSVEINRKASEYACENIKLNKVNDKVDVIQADVKKLKIKEKFSVLVMARPQLKETFLKYVWKFCKKNARIYYYDFGKNIDEIVKKITPEIKNKAKIINFKKAGEIAPYKYRWRIDLKVN